MDTTITYEQIIAQRLGAMEQAKKHAIAMAKAKTWFKLCEHFDV